MQFKKMCEIECDVIFNQASMLLSQACIQQRLMYPATTATDVCLPLSDQRVASFLRSVASKKPYANNKQRQADALIKDRAVTCLQLT